MLGWLSLEVALVCLDRMLRLEDEGEENLCVIGNISFFNTWYRAEKSYEK